VWDKSVRLPGEGDTSGVGKVLLVAMTDPNLLVEAAEAAPSPAMWVGQVPFTSMFAVVSTRMNDTLVY